MARQIRLVAAASVGNEPRVGIDLRTEERQNPVWESVFRPRRFRFFLALVVSMRLQIAGSKAKNKSTSAMPAAKPGR